MTSNTIPTGTVPPSGGSFVSSPVLEGLPATGSNEELFMLAAFGMFLLLVGFICYLTSKRS